MFTNVFKNNKENIILFIVSKKAVLYRVFGLSGPRPSYPALRSRSPGPIKVLSSSTFSQVKSNHYDHVHITLNGLRLFKPCFTHVTGTCFRETAPFFNVYLSCFVDFILCPTDKYMFKVNNKKIRLICMCSSLKINTACHRSFVFIVDFDHSQLINVVFLLLTLNKYLSVGCERQVIMF